MVIEVFYLKDEASRKSENCVCKSIDRRFIMRRRQSNFNNYRNGRIFPDTDRACHPGKLHRIHVSMNLDLSHFFAVLLDYLFSKQRGCWFSASSRPPLLSSSIRPPPFFSARPVPLHWPPPPSPPHLPDSPPPPRKIIFRMTSRRGFCSIASIYR